MKEMTYYRIGRAVWWIGGILGSIFYFGFMLIGSIWFAYTAMKTGTYTNVRQILTAVYIILGWIPACIITCAFMVIGTIVIDFGDKHGK